MYGVPEKLPITEEHDCNPISLYGIQKLTIENLFSITTTNTVLIINHSGFQTLMARGSRHIPIRVLSLISCGKLFLMNL